MDGNEREVSPGDSGQNQPLGLKKIAPYWYPYRTMAKGRWVGREMLEVVSTEFRDRSLEYYRYALESGVTTLNGVIAKPDTLIQQGDLIENIVHRHEPPVTSIPIKVLKEEPGQYIVIDKPGSIPVHSTGRYHRHSVVEILPREFGYKKVYPVNRLDRLTSGMMVLALSTECARVLSDEFMNHTIKKEYIARCKGEFPSEPVTCEEPLLTVDRQMGLNIVHPDGKPAKTVFTRMFYDKESDTSVLHCQPLTGRSHQIRVHLQFLGYPIANDPIYSNPVIWGEKGGVGGLSSVPSSERAAPVAPSHLSDLTGGDKETPSSEKRPALLPRETGEDIGMGSPVPLSSEAVTVITKLRTMKDEEDDWSRWKDVIFRAKASLVPDAVKEEVRNTPLEPKYKNVRKKGAKWVRPPTPEPAVLPPISPPIAPLSTVPSASNPDGSSEAGEKTDTSNTTFCPECYLPLMPDPSPEKLFIYLHALRYTTSLGSFETDMPHWAREDYKVPTPSSKIK